MSKPDTYLFDASKGQVFDFIEKLVNKKSLLGVDYGEKRLGLAISDNLLMIATPFLMIERVSFDKDVAKIVDAIKTREVCGIVCGLPLEMSGNFGKSAERASDFALKLIEGLNLPILLWDERLSTCAVENFLINTANLSRKKRAKVVDRSSAAYILQGALDFIKNQRKDIR